MKFSELEYSTRVIIKIALVVLGAAFLWAVRDVLALFLLALVLASAMDPLADYLHKKKIPRGVSVVAVYLLVMGLAALAISSILPPISAQMQKLALNLPDALARLQSSYPGLASLFGGQEGLSGLVRDVVSGGSEGNTVVSRTLGAFSGFFSFFTVLVVSFYLVVAERKGIKELIRPLVPVSRREQVIHLIEVIQKKMGLWVLGQIILSLAIFVFTYIGLSILGVEYALVLALIAGLLEVVPYIGPIVSAVPAFLFALLQSPALALGVIVLYLLIQKTESYVLVPKIMEKTVGVSPLVVIFALLIGFKLGGIVGLLLAVPLASAIMVVIEEFSGDQSNS
jgi:predicted PurR-regulated permease PerM